MKLIKMFNLTIVAAITALAFVGVSPASAHVDDVALCEKPELECKGHLWPNPTELTGHATNPKVVSAIGTVECEKSLIELTLLNQLKLLITAHVLSLVFEGKCHLGGTACTITVSEVGALSFTHGPNILEWVGIFVSLPLTETSMDTIANVKCGFLINCTYTFGEETKTTLTNTEAGEAILKANEAELKRTKGFCPEAAKFSATYEIGGANLWLES